MNPAVRRRVLAEWRGHYEPRPEVAAQSAGESLAAALKGLGLDDLLDEGRVAAAWAEVVGPFIAAHAKPGSLKKGVLTIRILNPSLRYELELAARSELLPRLQAKFGKKAVRKVEFRIG